MRLRNKKNTGTGDVRHGRAERVARTAVLTALAMIFSYVESLIPLSVGAPGVKIGLANLAVVTALYLFGPSYASVLNILRIVLTGFLFGNGSAILYSLAGGLLSFAVMLLLWKLSFSCLSVSAAGGVFHNIGQLAVACLVLENGRLVSYLPVLAFSGLVSGIVIGVISMETVKRLERIKSSLPL